MKGAKQVFVDPPGTATHLVFVLDATLADLGVDAGTPTFGVSLELLVAPQALFANALVRVEDGTQGRI